MKQSFRVVLSGGILVAALLVLQVRSSGEAVPLRQPLDAFPTTLGDWQGREAAILDEKILDVLKTRDYLTRRYVDPAGRSLWLFIGYWAAQRRGAQPHSPKNCLPGGGWEPLEASRLTIPLPPPDAPIIVNRYLIQKDREQQLVLYWYHSYGRAVADEVVAKIEVIKSSLFRNRTDGALVRVSSPVYGSVSETSDRLVQYVQAMYPVLREYFPD